MSEKRSLWKVSLLLLLVFASIHLLLILATGGYRITFGPFRLSANQLNNSVLIVLALGIAIRGLNAGTSASTKSLSLRSPGLLFLSVMFIYCLNGSTLGSGDTMPARYLPISLLRELDFDLNEFPFLYEPRIPYFLQKVDGHIVSAYPPWASLLAIPVYLLPVLGGVSPLSPMLPILEKLAATLITALSVIFLLFTLRGLTDEKNAWLIAAVYALGTSSFSTSSQGLWQHGPSQLFLTLTLYWLLKGSEESRFTAYAGFSLMSAILCRPTNVLTAIPLISYILWKQRPLLVWFCVTAIIPILGMVIYNKYYLGSPFRLSFAAATINPAGLWNIVVSILNQPLSEGLFGVLISPSRGLFIYSPILIFSFVGMVMAWKAANQIFLKCLSLAPLLMIFLNAKWGMWWGGYSYGPRLLADITPILCLFLYLPFEYARSRPVLRSILLGLSAISIGLHGLGAFGGGVWNAYYDIDRHPEWLWSWRDSPPVFYAENLAMEVGGRLKRSVSQIPTSRDDSKDLTTSYTLISLEPGLIAPSKTAMTIRLRAVNRGSVIWLARTKDMRGAVSLGWRWLSVDNKNFVQEEGRNRLRYDVFPGQSYEFTATINTPTEAGQYILEVGLVSEFLAWFSDRGVSPVRLHVHVRDPADYAAP